MQELLALRAAHRPGIRLDDDVLEAEPGEDALVGVALRLVARVEALVGDVERVGVLHRELASAQEAGARAGLVAVLVLDLVDRERQVLVRGVQVLHEQGEDLLVGGRQQVVGVLAVLQAEQALAVLGPAVRDLVGLTRQQGREVHLVRARRGHLLADDLLDPRLDAEADRQPREDARRLPADVAGAHEQAVAGHLGVGGIFAEGAEEVVGEASGHPMILVARPA